MSRFSLFFGIFATVLVLSDSYGYKFRRVPGSQDCRLQLNLPGYPPSYHSPIGSRYSEKFSGTGSSNKVIRPGTGQYGQGSKYGSGSGGSASSTSTGSIYGGYKPSQISNGDGYGPLGSSIDSSSSWSGSKNQGSGSAYGSGSDGYGSSSDSNLNSGNDKNSYNEGLKGYQTFNVKDMIECGRNEYYSKSLRKCVLTSTNNDGNDRYGANYDRYGSGSNIGSGSYSSNQQGYDQTDSLDASTPKKPIRVLASSSTAFNPNAGGFVGTTGTGIKNKGYGETQKDNYGSNGYGTGGSSSGESNGAFSGSSGNSGYGTNTDRDYYDKDSGSTNSGSNSGTYLEQSYGSGTDNGGYNNNEKDKFPSSGGNFAASVNKGSGGSGYSDTDFPDSSGGSYGSNSYDTNSNGNSEGNNFGTSEESYYGSSNSNNKYNQQYGSTGSNGYGTNSEDDYNTSGGYGNSGKNYGTTGSNSGSQGNYGSQSSSSDSSNNNYGSSASKFNSQSSYGQSGFNSNYFDNRNKYNSNRENVLSGVVGADGYDIKYAEEALEAHNIHRAKHSSPPLILDKDLSQAAQDLADKLASGYPFAHSADANEGKYGESIFVKLGPTTGSTAVNAWYRENVNYDFENPKLVQSPPTLSNDNFSALVWRSTRKLGIGKAVSKDGETFFVATYYPTGNIPSEVAENVFPPRRN